MPECDIQTRKVAKCVRRLTLRLAVLIYLLIAAVAIFAQANPRDYSISLPRVSYTADGAVAVVTFTVGNRGGDAREPSQIIIAENQTGQVAVNETLPALAAGAEQAFSIQLRLADLQGDDLFFKIEAGIDEFELSGSPIARNNSQLFRINAADARSGSGSPAGSASPARAHYDLFIPIVNLGVRFHADGIQFNDSRYSVGEILRGLGLAAAALFCLWLLSLILQLIFRRPPTFETWQPPYAVNTWYDPNSALGRRQGWQFHAQNSSISAARVPDQVTVIKRLLDRNGVVLGGWKIKAARTVQYDIYGRISRTEVVMPRTLIRQLNRIVRRAPTFDNPALRKAINPVAGRLRKSALAAIEKQNRMLPIALDMGFEGITGEARISFELYQCRNDAWHLIDQWEPEMGQIGAHIPEHFTFTLNGQLPGESYREFKRRLQEDLATLIAGMFYHHQGEAGTRDAMDADSTRIPETAASDRHGIPHNGSDDETDAH